jgi:hypothetical protein
MKTKASKSSFQLLKHILKLLKAHQSFSRPLVGFQRSDGFLLAAANS